MDEEKVLKNCAEEAWYLYQACLRLSKAYGNRENVTEKELSEYTRKLNSQIASILLGIESIVDAGIMSNESIESIVIAKHEEFMKRIEKGDN